MSILGRFRPGSGDSATMARGDSSGLIPQAGGSGRFGGPPPRLPAPPAPDQPGWFSEKSGAYGQSDNMANRSKIASYNYSISDASKKDPDMKKSADMKKRAAPPKNAGIPARKLPGQPGTNAPPQGSSWY